MGKKEHVAACEGAHNNPSEERGKGKQESFWKRCFFKRQRLYVFTKYDMRDVFPHHLQRFKIILNSRDACRCMKRKFNGL